MSLSINNNSASLVALEALNAAQSELSKTENTVSTGKKVSNAADNPAIYSIAAQMNGNLQGMIAVSDSLSLGAQVVATANTAGNQIVTSLQSLQNTVSTAGQTGTDASAMATQILSTLDSINSYARNATFSGVNLLTSGSDAVNAYNGTTLRTVTNVQGQTQAFTTMSGSSTTLVDALGLTSNSASGSSAAESTQNIFSSLNSGNVSNISAINLSDITLGTGATAGSTVTVGTKTFEFVQNGDTAQAGNISVSLDEGYSVKTAMSALVSAMNGAGVASSLNSDNSVSVSGAHSDISMQTPYIPASIKYTSADLAKSVKLDDGSATGDTIKIGSITYNFVETGTATPQAASGNTVYLASDATVADALKAIASQVPGASFDATAGVLATGTNNITASFNNIASPPTATVYNGAATAVSAFTVTAGSAKDQIAVGIKSGVASAVSAIQSAITNMSSVMQNLGNYSNTLSGLSTYSSSLKDAVTNGVSALTDADMAAASAQLTSLQTKQSLAIKSLTIANGQSQSILSLFQ
jgi:flagellin